MADVMKEIFGNKLRKDSASGSFKERCATDFKLFCEHYLAESFPSPWSHDFHDWTIAKLEDITLEHSNEETRDCLAAPRGHAKSTLCSFAYPLWLTCYNYKKFIVIVSATSTVAKQFLVNIRNELEFNARIREDFGDLKSDSIWNNTEILTLNKVYITCKSAGTQLRGLNFNGTRPDTVIFDDLETPEQVDSVAQTESLERWFNSDAMPMGSPTASYIYIGTVLSYESLLYHMLKNGSYSMWNRKMFQAVIEFSTSPLWAEWEEIMTDPERGDQAYADANKFYEEHKEAMLEGTKVLWEAQRPNMYKHLMERRIASEEGFASEYQNDPQTESTRVFKTEWLENNMYVDLPEIKEVCMAIDPAIASRRVSDYSVIVVMGKGKDNLFYVLEADIQKRKPDRIIEDAKEIIRKYYKYKPQIVVETNQMQAFFSSTLQRDMVNAGIYLDWVEVYHKAGDSKAGRIEALVPYVKNGYIKFHAGQRILLSQFKNYPKVHDDGPDAVEMAFKQLLGNTTHSFGFGSTGVNTKRKENQPFYFIKQALLGRR